MRGKGDTSLYTCWWREWFTPWFGLVYRAEFTINHFMHLHRPLPGPLWLFFKVFWSQDSNLDTRDCFIRVSISETWWKERNKRRQITFSRLLSKDIKITCKLVSWLNSNSFKLLQVKSTCPSNLIISAIKIDIMLFQISININI